MTDEHGRLRRRAANGVVYHRVAKRQPVTHETWSATSSLYHWCSSETPEALTAATPAHVCDIWEVSDDQTEPEMQPAEAEPTTDELIRRILLFTEEQLTGEPTPLLTRAAVLAALKQAKALEQIIVLLEDWKQHRQRPRRIALHITSPPANPSPNEQR